MYFYLYYINKSKEVMKEILIRVKTLDNLYLDDFLFFK